MAIVTPGIIYLQEMQCGDCGTVLQIKEKETTTIIVNIQGLPVNSDCTDYSVEAVCPKCGRRYEVEKEGMYFQLRNKTYELCPLLKLKESMELGFGVEI